MREQLIAVAGAKDQASIDEPVFRLYDLTATEAELTQEMAGDAHMANRDTLLPQINLARDKVGFQFPPPPVPTPLVACIRDQFGPVLPGNLQQTAFSESRVNADTLIQTRRRTASTGHMQSHPTPCAVTGAICSTARLSLHQSRRRSWRPVNAGNQYSTGSCIALLPWLH